MDITKSFIEELGKMKNSIGGNILHEVKPINNMNDTNFESKYLYGFVEQVLGSGYKYSDDKEASIIVTFVSSHSNSEEALIMIANEFYEKFNMKVWDNVIYCSITNISSILPIKIPTVGKIRQAKLVVRFK
jgi:hypothetical protein